MTQSITSKAAELESHLRSLSGCNQVFILAFTIILCLTITRQGLNNIISTLRATKRTRSYSHLEHQCPNQSLENALILSLILKIAFTGTNSAYGELIRIMK